MSRQSSFMSRRKIRVAAEDTLTPPETLTQSQMIARVVKNLGKDLYTVETADATDLLVELDARFRGTIFVRRGGYVLVDTVLGSERDNKIQGEIVNIVRDEKSWRKQSFWPRAFIKKPAVEDSDEDSVTGKMPPSDNEDD
jgi:probable RNA-binding protein EIF1AD